MVHGCIIAGGVGKRYGADVPKQFIEVEGKPIIVYTMERFEACPSIDVYDVVCVDGYQDIVESYRDTYGLRKFRSIVDGGPTFGESVRNGVYALADIAKPDDIFAVHMSIAPLVSDEILADLVNVCEKCGNAFSAHPSYMCMCESDQEGYSDTFLDREKIWALNTPQAVRYQTILDLYREAEAEGFDIQGRTHLSTLMFDKGQRLYFSLASPINIKITDPDDTELFRAFVVMRQQDDMKQGEEAPTHDVFKTESERIINAD